MARGRDVSKLADDVRIRVERGYKLSNPTYEVEHITADYAWIQMTCCIRECGETCGVHIPSPSDEYDECNYEVEISEDGVNWRKVGLDIEELTSGTFYYVRVRTVDLPGNRCLASDWVTKTFTTVRKETCVIDISTPGYELYASDERDREGARIGYTPTTFNCLGISKGDGLYEGEKWLTVYKNPETAPATGTRKVCAWREYMRVFKYDDGAWELDEVHTSPELDLFGRRTTSQTGISMPISYCRPGSGLTAMTVTVDSAIPLWIWDEDGEEMLPCTRVNAMAGGTVFGITVCEDGYDKLATLVFPHTHIVPPFTMPFDTTLSDARTPAELHGRYTGNVHIDGANGIVHVTLTSYPPGAVGTRITATSPIPLYFSAGGDAPKLIPHTVSAGILGEASQLLTGMTEADILEYYHVDFLEERVYKTVRGGYEITATWNLGQGTVHFELTPVAQVTVDIAASIAAGGIPEAIRTGRDEEITFIVKNLGTEAVVADVFLTFENHDIPRVYPHDLTGLEPLGDGYSLPGSNIMILEDAYVARRWISLGAGASGSYMLTVQLPHDAIPPGEASATYTIKTKVGTYQ